LEYKLYNCATGLGWHYETWWINPETGVIEVSEAEWRINQYACDYSAWLYHKVTGGSWSRHSTRSGTNIITPGPGKLVYNYYLPTGACPAPQPEVETNLGPPSLCQ
jgi:hypothetical protein